jgi:COP9 signalosome complex subunit 1
LYFQPFATIRLDRMSAAFGWTVDEVEAQVVALIQNGSIQGRVDSQNKVPFVFYVRRPEYRLVLFSVDSACEKDRLPR